MEIMINGGRVPCTVKELGSRHYLASFVPNHPVTHVVEMRFNGDVVKGMLTIRAAARRGGPWRLGLCPKPRSLGGAPSGLWGGAPTGSGVMAQTKPVA